jgi:hypothetical protein
VWLLAAVKEGMGNVFYLVLGAGVLCAASVTSVIVL